MSSTSTKNRDVFARALARCVNVQKRQQKQDRQAELLSAPTHEDWWPGEPDFKDLVPRADQEKDMEIEIDRWPNGAFAGETDKLQFQWKSSISDTWQPAQPVIDIPGPLEDFPFPMTLTLLKANFATEGTFDLRYLVTLDNNTTTASDITKFIIDKTPPNNNQFPDVPTFPDPVVISDGITEGYLTANGGVEIAIPPYQDQQPGDSLWIYVHNPATSPTAPTYTGVLDAERKIKIPTVAFDGLQDGLIYVSYALLDKVGNHTSPSNNATAGLFRKPLPEELTAPRVPRISDSILNLDDIANGTVDLVESDAYENALDRSKRDEPHSRVLDCNMPPCGYAASFW